MVVDISEGFSALWHVITDLFLMMYGGAGFIFDFFVGPNDFFEGIPLIEVLFSVGIVACMVQALINFFNPL